MVGSTLLRLLATFVIVMDYLLDAHGKQDLVELALLFLALRMVVGLWRICYHSRQSSE